MIMSHGKHAMLRECLDNIKKYTPFEYDLVIVDDASEPAYEPFALDGATIVRMPKRSDCCNLRNVGMAMSQGEFVFWVDNDSMVGEGWYKPLIDAMKDDVGLTGQIKDSRLIRKPFLPLTQSDCMIEYEFAYDYNHLTGECDFITSYCVLVRKSAYRPTHCYDMPTPCLDPELGAVVKSSGFKVKVCENINVHHLGSGTPRPNGREYLYHLSENFTKWWKFWEPKAHEVFELYKPNNPVEYTHDANEGNRAASRGQHGDLDLDQPTGEKDLQVENNPGEDGLAHRL